MKKVLVTGAAGFIGSHIVKVLLSKNYEVYALIENNERSKKSLLSISPDIKLITNLESGSSYPAFDIIFHLATVGVRPDFDDIELFCDVNIKMSCKLVDFAKENCTGLLVNFGSCFEYGDHGNILLEESMNCMPESLYAISKLASTNLTMAYAKNKNINFIVVRPFGVFGEGEGDNRLAPSIIKNCLKGKKTETTMGEQIRDFVDVKDVSKAIVTLCESNYENYQIYNICSDNPITVRKFIEEIVDTCGFDMDLIDFGALPYRENESMFFAGNNSKLQKVINYQFPCNHKRGILDIYESMKEK